MSKTQELGRLFYRELIKIHRAPMPDTPPQYAAKITALYQLLHTIFVQVTMQERVPFNTFFARVAYAFQKYEVNRQRQRYIHEFRKRGKIVDNEQVAYEVYQLGIKAVADAVKIFCAEDPSVEVLQILPPADFYRFTRVDVAEKKPFMRVVVLGDDVDNEQWLGVEEDSNSDVKIQYNIAERNENFKRSVLMMRHVFGFPTTLHLLDNEVDTEGVVRPRAFVIEPDYLVDVTAIAECFSRDVAEPLLYLLKKFTPYEVTSSIMKGNIANFFLDELMANPEVTFSEVFPKTFKINALAFCNFEQGEVQEIYNASQGHFINLKRVLNDEFPKQGIKREACYLEPSFYAPKYGLQGRLDLFYQNPNDGKSAIVELKSGKPFKPNVYGISNNHFTQTLLYDLLVEAAFDKTMQPVNYILYSVLEQDNLKFAPVVRSQQFEALNVRNQILALEQMLINLVDDVADGKVSIMARMIERLSQSAAGFEKRDVALVSQVYNGLSTLERAYFEAFVAFVAREHQISKIGLEESETANGVAALWLEARDRKDDNFELLANLTIQANNSLAADPHIVFKRTAATNALANFRVGDVVVLYPTQQPKRTKNTEGGQNQLNFELEQGEQSQNPQSPISQSHNLQSQNLQSPIADVRKNQIFKCSLIELTKETVTLRLRSRQLNQHIFQDNEFWNVEHDLLDSSFNAMFRGIFEFMRSPQRKKDLILTLAPPQKADNTGQATVGSYLSSMGQRTQQADAKPTHDYKLTDEQKRIFEKIIHSKDYFLLWGPPGTGKTSVMLRALVGHYLMSTDENIMLLAYTNRAVDEICEAIDSLGAWVKPLYLRIGSRYSTNPVFHEQLLDKKLEAVKTRKELREILSSHRVYVATVASLAGKPELFEMMKFNRVLIDEASQILEPQLVGLLTHFDHFTLIGDHKQLPAVVQQPDYESAIFEDNPLHKIGLKNRRNSLFERLYKRAVSENWHWTYDILSHQGRMHTDIMQFPAAYFYEKKLQILPEGLNQFQLQQIDLQLFSNEHPLEARLVKNRVLFLHSDIDTANGFKKTNAHEARLVSDLVTIFQKNTAQNTPLSIGVITPYRAQIAQIQATLREANIDTEKITVDTVERYQGGARDVILLSLCTNDVSQLSSLVSLSEEGVDRKLNVALTRARQHLVVIGNTDILRGSEIYRRFIETYGANF